MEQIIIEINADAEVKLTTKGFKGKSCKEATKEFEAKLGRTVEDNATEEMYQNGNANIRSRV